MWAPSRPTGRLPHFAIDAPARAGDRTDDPPYRTESPGYRHGMRILHFCPAAAWRDACERGEYAADTLATEGFIHCSTPDQVHVPANALCAGRTDLVLLEIETGRVSAPIRHEPAHGQVFPHVYGPIP